MFPIHDENPSATTAYVTISVIAVCVAIFLWQFMLGVEGQQLVYQFGLIPAVLFEYRPLPAELAVLPAWLTVISSMFLHGGWLHLLGNMLYLWVFGNNIEDAMGHSRFIIFYIVCGIAAAMAQVIPDTQSVIPMIGASGAISGVLGAYLMLYPRARVLVVIPIFFYMHIARIKAGWVLGIWFAIQIISSIAFEQSGGGVAWGAHIGGFLAGILLIGIFKHRHVRFFSPR